MAKRLTPVVPIRLTGPGLFTGQEASLTISGTMGREGLWFEREDLEGRNRCRATTEALSLAPIHPAFAAMPPRSTTLQTTSGALVGTVEHILSALEGMGITDAMLELDAPEVPFSDGSALRFAEMLEFTDPSEEGPLDILCLPHSVEVVDERDPTARIVGTPRAAPGRSFRYDLDYTGLTGPLGRDAAALGRQSASWDGATETYLSQVAPARTFCLQGEYDALRGAGLLAGTPNDSAIVFGPSGPVNTALRFPDEPARHKLLDLIGDLALIGARVQMDVHATKSGHALSHRFARAVRALVVKPLES